MSSSKLRLPAAVITTDQLNIASSTLWAGEASLTLNLVMTLKATCWSRTSFRWISIPVSPHFNLILLGDDPLTSPKLFTDDVAIFSSKRESEVYISKSQISGTGRVHECHNHEASFCMHGRAGCILLEQYTLFRRTRSAHHARVGTTSVSCQERKLRAAKLAGRPG